MTDKSVDAFCLQQVERFGVCFLLGFEGSLVDGGVVEFVGNFQGPDLIGLPVDADSNCFSAFRKQTLEVRMNDSVRVIHQCLNERVCLLVV